MFRSHMGGVYVIVVGAFARYIHRGSNLFDKRFFPVKYWIVIAYVYNVECFLVSGIFHGDFAQRLAVNKPCLQIVRRLLWKQTTTHSIRNNNPIFDREEPLVKQIRPTVYRFIVSLTPFIHSMFLCDHE